MAHHFWSYYRTLEHRSLQAGDAVVVGIPCGKNTLQLWFCQCSLEYSRFKYGFTNHGFTTA
jgi:hypothetical protein